MKRGTTKLSFREIMKPNSRPYMLSPDQGADLLGMRLYGAGPFHREFKSAMAIVKKSHFVVRSGDVIYNKLFAWKGAFGLVPKEFDGMFVSDKFPTYELDRDRVFDGYLAWFFRHPKVWEQARTMSTGSAALSKLTLNPPKFLDLEIYLPPMPEQVRVAKWLDDLAGKTKEAKALRTEADREFSALMIKARDVVIEKIVVQGCLRDVLSKPPRNGWSPVCDNDGAGVPVLTLSAITGWNFNPAAFKRTSLPVKEDAHYWTHAGDLLMTRSNTPELVGHAAINSGSLYPCIYPDLVMKLSVDKEKANTRFVWYWLQSTAVRNYIKRSAKGTSPTMKKISQGIVETIPFPSHLSLFEQTKFVRRLDELQSKLSTTRGIQRESVEGLDAILPAILHQTFGNQVSDNTQMPNSVGRKLRAVD